MGDRKIRRDLSHKRNEHKSTVVLYSFVIYNCFIRVVGLLSIILLSIIFDSNAAIMGGLITSSEPKYTKHALRIGAYDHWFKRFLGGGGGGQFVAPPPRQINAG